MAETDRRRAKQIEFNVLHGITPRTIVKAVGDVMEGARSVQESRSLASGGDWGGHWRRNRRSNASRSWKRK